jgi:hypothetical protein
VEVDLLARVEPGDGRPVAAPELGLQIGRQRDRRRCRLLADVDREPLGQLRIWSARAGVRQGGRETSVIASSGALPARLAMNRWYSTLK